MTMAAIGAARKEVREGELIPVPKHLRDSHYAGAKDFGHGEGYQYSHNDPDGFVAQDYLGVDRVFYEPSPRGWEGGISERLFEIRKQFKAAKGS